MNEVGKFSNFPDALIRDLETLSTFPSYISRAKLARQLAGLEEAARRIRAPRSLRIALGGNCNTDFLKPSLIVRLANDGFDADCSDLDYDGWIGAALAGQPMTDWWVIWHSAAGASRGGVERRAFDREGMKAASEAIIARGQNLLVILPEALSWEDDPFSPFAKWRQELTAEIEEVLPPSVIRMPVEQIQRSLGDDAWKAPRYWTTAKCPAHPDAAAAVGDAAGRAIALALRPRVKALLVDLDNTLWGGVVGDDGPEGLMLDSDGEGRAYLEMQRFVKDLSASGVPVCIVSKNEPDQAMRPFAERPEMILQRSDILSVHASWAPKHEAISSIAAELNLGIENLCFIDDSPHERDQALAFLPDLIVPDIPEDAEVRVASLLRTGLFSNPVLREEDRRRVDLYREESRRKEARAGAMDYESYLRSLEMRLIVSPVNSENMPRVASLVQKTNQFNLTGKRMSSADITLLAADKAAYASCVALRDRFGDAGIIGVLLANTSDNHAVIQEWILSCRVFGRGVEDAMFDHFTAWMTTQGLETVIANHKPTKRNGMLEEVLPRLGFVVGRTEGDITRWEAHAPLRPSHALTIEA